MAFSELRPSGRYRGGYRDANGNKRYVEGTFVRAKQAKDAATVAEANSRSLGWRDPKAAKNSYADWVMDWWPTRTVAANTYKTDLIRMNLHVLPKWGDVPLHVLEKSRNAIKTWAVELAATPNGRGEDDYGEPLTLSPSSVRNITTLLSGSLAAAVDEGILVGNPAARLKLPPPTPAQERFLTHDEYDAIYSRLPTGHDRLIADSLVGTGLRFGEFAGAHWARVNQAAGGLLVAESWEPVEGRMKAYPKGKRLRDIPVDSALLDRWEELERPDSCGKSHKAGRCMSGLIMRGVQGAPLDAHNWNARVWTPAVEAAGVGHCRVHDLRHTYASWLLQSGRSLAEVGKLLGHQSPTTTSRYAWLEQSNRGDVLAALKPRSTAAKKATAQAGLQLVK